MHLSIALMRIKYCLWKETEQPAAPLLGCWAWRAERMNCILSELQTKPQVCTLKETADESLPHGMEGHSDGSSAAPVNVIQWFCGQVTMRPLGSFPRYKSLGCGKVSRLPTVAKLEHCTAIFLCQPMDSTQTHPEWRITHTCSYLGNLMFQYWNEIYFNFVVIFWCKTTSFGPETLPPILTKWFPGLQQYKLWSVRVFLMFSSLNWHPKMLIQHHQLLLFSFFFYHFY